MDKWTHPLEPPIIKQQSTAVPVSIILLVLQVKHVRLMEYGDPLHLTVNVSTPFGISTVETKQAGQSTFVFNNLIWKCHSDQQLCSSCQ